MRAFETVAKLSKYRPATGGPGWLAGFVQDWACWRGSGTSTLFQWPSRTSRGIQVGDLSLKGRLNGDAFGPFA